jgi:hypothetical protein
VDEVTATVSCILSNRDRAPTPYIWFYASSRVSSLAVDQVTSIVGCTLCIRDTSHVPYELFGAKQQGAVN